MADQHRFSLVFGGVSISNINDLRKNYSEKDALGYYQNGLLCKWLNAWNYKEEYDLIANLSVTDEELLKKSIHDILMGQTLTPGKLPIIELSDIAQPTVISNFDVDNMSLSQIIKYNPITKELPELQQMYFYCLYRYVKLGKWKNTYTYAQLDRYRKILCGNKSDKGKSLTNAQFRSKSFLLKKYVYLMVLDLFLIIGFSDKEMQSENMKIVLATMIVELPFKFEDLSKMVDIHSAVINNTWERIEKISELDRYKDYVDRIRTNLSFKRRRPTRFMVTATMSAGKSTFINALSGKNVNLSRNTACTSKIHHLISKPYEDGCTSKFDKDFIIDATDEELMHNNEKNVSDDIFISTYFTGLLNGKRIVLYDSPGVNSSKNADHQSVTEKMIETHGYDMILYIINATQIGTNDDEAHLNYVCQNIGKTPILFIVNKIDEFREGEDDVGESLCNIIKYLKKIGFKDPVICPVSAKSGYLAKIEKKGEKLSQINKNALNNKIMYFEDEKNDLSSFYEKYYPELHLTEPEDEINQLLKHSGLTYIEKIISRYC